MLIKTRAIVFRSYKFGETSLIVELYTEAKGLRKYVVNGVRAPKSRTPQSLLQPMSLLDIVAYEREDRDLNRLQEVRPAHVYQHLPFDVKKGAVGLFMAELAGKAIREREENAQLFKFLFEQFTFLDACATSISHYHLGFLVELSAYLGIFPAGEFSAQTPFFDMQQGEFTARCPEHPYYLGKELAQSFSSVLDCTTAERQLLNLPHSHRQRLLEEGVRYYQLHLEGMGQLHALEVLKTVFM